MLDDDGIVVVEVGRKGNICGWPNSGCGRTQLGDDATFGLIELLETERKEVGQQMLAMAVERFERRLAEELGKFRHDVVQELATTRVEMLRWSFVFWIGQVAAFAALLAYVRR